jgi:hypothetical protein
LSRSASFFRSHWEISIPTCRSRGLFFQNFLNDC